MPASPATVPVCPGTPPLVTQPAAAGVRTAIDRARRAVRPWASVTRTVKDEAPDDVGVPLTAPVGLSDRPAGRAPETTSQEKGADPPDAWSCPAYALVVQPTRRIALVTR